MARTVVVAGGTGNVGRGIVRALVKSKNYKVIVLSREGSTEKTKSLEDAGVIVRKADPMDASSLAQALEGADVVISAVNGDVLYQGQLNLVAAAKAAGVKRFFPSEFGVDITREGASPMFGAKLAVAKAIVDAGMEYTRMFTGFFPETTINPGGWLSGHLQTDISSGKVVLPGDGNQLVSFTTIADVGRFTVAALDDYEGSKNKLIYVEGSRVSFNQIVSIFKEANPGKSVNVSYRSLDDIKAAVATRAHPYDKIVDQLAQELANGGALLDQSKLSSYPTVQAQTVRDYIVSGFKTNE